MNFIKKLFLFGALAVLASLIAYFLYVSHNKKGIMIVNVLNKELYDDLHIAGSIHVPYEEVEESINNNWSTLPKDTPVIFYCSNYACSASGEVARYMRKQGFSHAYAYEGGMAEWFNLHKQDKTYKIVGEGKQSYLTRLNPVKPAPTDVKIVSAEQLKKMLGDNRVKGW